METKLKEQIEWNALKAVKNYLQLQGKSLAQEKHEPSGKSLFPDFYIEVDGKPIFLEITSSGQGDVYENGRKLAEDYKKTDKFLNGINKQIKSWLPKEYRLCINIEGRVRLLENKLRITGKVANFLKQAFINKRMCVSKREILNFSSCLNWIKSANFVRSNQIQLLQMPLSNLTVPLDFGDEPVIFFMDAIHMCNPEEGEELKRVINRKVYKRQQAIQDLLIPADSEIWLIIINDGLGFDFFTYKLAFENLRKQGINIVKDFFKILIVSEDSRTGQKAVWNFSG